MTELNQIYKCNVCGNIVEVLHTGEGTLVCCGQNMELLKEKTQDEGQEKHVPVVENTDDSAKVKVGETPHPMTDEHYIEWIESTTIDGKRVKKFLKPGNEPKAKLCAEAKAVSARAYCNIHGLWKS